MGDALPFPPDPRLVTQMLENHAQYVKMSSKGRNSRVNPSTLQNRFTFTRLSSLRIHHESSVLILIFQSLVILQLLDSTRKKSYIFVFVFSWLLIELSIVAF